MFTKSTFAVAIVFLVSAGSVSGQTYGYDQNPYGWRPVSRIDSYPTAGSPRHLPAYQTNYERSLYGGNAAYGGSAADFRPTLISRQAFPESAYRNPAAYPISGVSGRSPSIFPGGCVGGRNPAYRYPVPTTPIVRGASPQAHDYYVGGNVYGSRTSYKSSQPVRNFFRYILP